MSQEHSLSRRRFVAATAKGVALIPALNLVSANAAEPLPRIEETHAMAVALGYRHVADEVDVAQFPRRAGAEGKTQFCDNCIQYETENEQDGWAPCKIFPGFTVAAKGWCNVWVIKPA